MTSKQIYLAGIDVGSTTTKIVVMDPADHTIIYSDYQRHHSAQLNSVMSVLSALKDRFPGASFRIAMTGSGARPIATLMDVSFIQEVVASSIVLKEHYQSVGTAIELGGQDAKMIFFGRDSVTGEQTVMDMRMNGSCAGGTGAFIDEVATLLKVPIHEFNAAAEAGKTVYDISGRCGVYAKTDIQPLLNQGVAREDLALSSFHAIAKQTIGGLAQGLDITPPVAFLGGPLTFNPRLVEVFAERLDLAEDQILQPEHAEILIAAGAALSLESIFSGTPALEPDTLMSRAVSAPLPVEEGDLRLSAPYFENKAQLTEFRKRHRLPDTPAYNPAKGETVRAYLGIDSGSTTTKFVLLRSDGRILDSFYSSNEGDPLIIAKNALIRLRDRYEQAGARLEVIACGTTGYGEHLFNRAFHTECHVVETVAHSRAVSEYIDDATFILDIGGQDMKAIWLDDGIISNIVVNEACSSGCGSFLENFGHSLGIPAEEIADRAFESEAPAVLGSRCTVFMNSSIITEQRNGKSSADICAGLCRSIIENVFTKVIRVSNLDSLGDKIVVQGGTFRNDAVLRALEQYTQREVVRAPYPGLMGAIGAALITRDKVSSGEIKGQTFIGLDAISAFSYTRESDLLCPFCANHCRRTVVRFPDGTSWVTGNRCERGEIMGDPKDPETRKQLQETNAAREAVPNLFRLREKLLFRDVPVDPVDGPKDITIGLPRVLSYWDTMPFWKAFWTALGFRVIVSPESSRKIYENGLHAVPSDTICFPAKLVHGHLRALAKMGCDRIFMPSITTIPSENTEATSESMCAVVKGYPIVIRNSDNPVKKIDLPFDAPLFHWHTDTDRDRQLTRYMEDTYGIAPALTRKAMAQGDKAQLAFRSELQQEAEKILEQTRKDGTFAVVLASRPYQNDPLVNHDLPDMFTRLGIPVLTADSLPEIGDVVLRNSRIDVVNNYHARMLSSAVLAAESPNLEYVQIVSFGCGHDAYLSDEIIRMMKEISGKTPLVLKVDESDITGPLQIRVRSFVETIQMRRARGTELVVRELEDPYPVKFRKEDVSEKIVLVPNTSHAFCRIMSAAMKTQHIRAVPLAIGRDRAIALGKKYVHNDICFPAQIVIGEILAALENGFYKPGKVAVAMAKYIGDCRLTHYGALLRKALDDAGYTDVPLLTNDDKDYHNMHPGYKMNLQSALRLATALPMIDAMEDLLRKIRPYEIHPGSTDRAFEKGMDAIVSGLEKHGVPGARAGFRKAIDGMKKVLYDRSNPRPTVLIVGEYLLNFHPGANHDIENYLEKNGFEIIEAKMTDVIRKTYFYQDSQVREYKVKKKPAERATIGIENRFFDVAHAITDRIASRHPLYEPPVPMPELVKDSDDVIHHTFDAGEGVLIPAEIIHNAKKGCRNFVILQPFGCLPNHVVGRGIAKRLKEMFPDAHILPLDYDPDVSFANVENRLQMLIMNQN